MCILFFQVVETVTGKSLLNKKVLLRERKRHTARRVASARYAAVIRGGDPISGLGRGVPHPRSR